MDNSIDKVIGWIPTRYSESYTEYSVTYNVDDLYSIDSAIVAESIEEAMEFLEATFGTPGLAIALKPYPGDKLYLYEHPFIGNDASLPEFVSLVKQFKSVHSCGLSLYSYKDPSWVSNSFSIEVPGCLSNRYLSLLKEGVWSDAADHWIYDPDKANQLLGVELKKQRNRERRSTRSSINNLRYSVIDKYVIVQATYDMFLTISSVFNDAFGLRNFEISITNNNSGYYGRITKSRASIRLLDVLYAYNHLFGPNSYRKHPAFQNFKNIWAEKTVSAIKRSGLSVDLVTLMAEEVSIKPPRGKTFSLRGLKTLKKESENKNKGVT